MAATLFRPEAVDFQRTRNWAGMTSIAPPLAHWLLASFFAAAVVAAAIFLTFSTYARKETVPGYLTPVSGIAKVMPPATGVVADLYVTEGNAVAAGQRLMVVRSERRGIQDQGVDATVVDRLQAKRDTLIERIDIEQRTAAEERQSLSETTTALEAQVDTLTTSLHTQQERQKVAHDQVESVRSTVAQGYTSVAEFRRREDAELAQQQATTDLFRQISAKAVEVREKRHAIATLDAKTADDVAVIHTAIDDVEASLAEAHGKQGYTVYAPIAGRVTSLQAWVGMSVELNRPLMSVVPQASPLQVELLIPARAIGFVASGQAVRVAFDAFPFQRFGFYDATITSVAGTITAPNESVGSIALGEPAYRVTAHLERQAVTAYGAQVPLRPDMSLKANIVFDRRSLFQWLFDPLLSARGNV